MDEFVNVNVMDGLATIHLDRPPTNALNAPIQTELSEAVAEVRADPEVHAAVTNGGPKPFAAGADVQEMADMAYPDMALATIPGCARRRPRTRAVRRFPDFGNTVKLGQPEILLGIIPGLVAPSGCPGSSDCPGRRSRVHRPARGRSPGRPASGQAGHRRWCRSRRRPGDRVGPLLRPVRHRGPENRHAELHRARSGNARFLGR